MIPSKLADRRCLLNTHRLEVLRKDELSMTALTSPPTAEILHPTFSTIRARSAAVLVAGSCTLETLQSPMSADNRCGTEPLQHRAMCQWHINRWLSGRQHRIETN
jgi:hypothetical protein